jgi:ubiquinone/menaquinone biosynthesis C-methylase UbiE/DNA-binding transcriptional ArsR family regulator
MAAKLELLTLVDTLKATAESSRLRILFLLASGDLTVTDLTAILNQSQPRVSRHLKLLQEAGLVDRYQEGSWAYFRLAEGERDLVLSLLNHIASDDPLVERDAERLFGVRNKRQEKAASYFSVNAASWDRIRSLHAPDKAVEDKMLALVGSRPFQAMADLGTGTGRLLELFAPLYRRGIGIDMSREMLAVARANLERAGITHAQVRQGDVYAPPVDRGGFDLVTLHQVLHYLDDPAAAIREAAKLLRPSGRLLIVDFAPHELEFLREHHAHVRLGFGDRQIGEWLSEADLDLDEQVAIAPANNEGGLTVKLWLARDRRLLIADTNAHPQGETV